MSLVALCPQRLYSNYFRHHYLFSTTSKRTAKVHRIRSNFDLETRMIALRIEGESEAAAFHLDVERAAVEQWLSAYFGFAVRLLQNTETGFPDDTTLPGPTVISTETLRKSPTGFPT